MKTAISEKSKVVFDYLVSIGDENVTAQDIADALGLERKSVDGIVTAGLQRKGYTERIPAKIETEDGVKEVKFIKLTEAGKAYDHDAAVKADAEAAAN